MVNYDFKYNSVESQMIARMSLVTSPQQYKRRGTFLFVEQMAARVAPRKMQEASQSGPRRKMV